MWFDLALIALGGFLAALVIGSAGFFAFAIVITGIWIYVLPSVQIVLLASICATLLQGASVWWSRARDRDAVVVAFCLRRRVRRTLSRSD
jgi:hypothetical protein